MTTAPCTIDWNFIATNEGNSKQGYVPCDENGVPIGHSGVTIGMGIDLGQMTPANLQNIDIPVALRQRLIPYTEKKGMVAKEFLHNWPLVLNGADVSLLNSQCSQAHAKIIENEYNANSDFTFGFLDSDKQTVIMDVGWQYGSIKNRCPHFFGMITKGQWQDAVHELRNFGDKYPTRRNLEADLLEKSLQQ